MAEQRGQFVGECLEVLVALVGVDVESATAIGHHHHERFTFDIPLDRGSPHPNGFVVAEAVEQEHAVIRPWYRRIRKDHLERGRFAEGAGEILDSMKCHVASLLGLYLTCTRYLYGFIEL